MQINIKNQITLDGEVELIHEVYEGDLTLKGNFAYLMYKNDEGEKVVIKFNKTSLVMTRFSNPQSIMRFENNQFASCNIPTPMGVQKIVSKTNRFEYENDVVSLTYDLLPHIEAEQALASYQLEISW